MYQILEPRDLSQSLTIISHSNEMNQWLLNFISCVRAGLGQTLCPALGFTRSTAPPSPSFPTRPLSCRCGYELIEGTTGGDRKCLAPPVNIHMTRSSFVGLGFSYGSRFLFLELRAAAVHVHAQNKQRAGAFSASGRMVRGHLSASLIFPRFSGATPGVLDQFRCPSWVGFVWQ